MFDLGYLNWNQPQKLKHKRHRFHLIFPLHHNKANASWLFASTGNVNNSAASLSKRKKLGPFPCSQLPTTWSLIWTCVVIHVGNGCILEQHYLRYSSTCLLLLAGTGGIMLYTTQHLISPGASKEKLVSKLLVVVMLFLVEMCGKGIYRRAARIKGARLGLYGTSHARKGQFGHDIRWVSAGGIQGISPKKYLVLDNKQENSRRRRARSDVKKNKMVWFFHG